MPESLSNEQYALMRVRYYVWSGFYSSQDIEDILYKDDFRPGQIDVDWVRTCIDHEFATKLEQQLEWPEETDCDRLDEAFAALEHLQMIALQNAGLTQSDGMEDVSEVWHERGGEKSRIVGYCFYHAQDLERVIKGKVLQLTFGDIGGDDEKGVAIGNMVCDAFRRLGFTVVWNEDIKTRIQIPGIAWKRRTPEY
ncbi:hypothetical protein [Roseimicrobium sp. ORNL1]|uniref:DUF6891 domain-containing protein n=1 Tax=Roseimicrobium sp. ORNL1 TaxID=2711231 RepID=UPI0013E15CED|nr:hypothetical protein [Roseimicrobium sp. ORNL1]QIF01028.1 hypothetical protein G5S37_05675 [Roseimicrobium sp. ORNL1]